jgi:hypothetical protein
MVALGVGELEAGNDPPGLGRVVVLDRGLEVLAKAVRLSQLPAKPAPKADLGRTPDGLETHCAPTRSVTKPNLS